MNKLDNYFWSFFNHVRGRKDLRGLREVVISLFFLKQANDEDFSNPFNKISLPQNSEWVYLINNLEDLNFLNLLKEAFFSLEKENDHLKNTFSSFYFIYDFNNEFDLQLVKNLFIKISEFGLLEGDVSFSNFIGELLSKFADYEGKKGGDFTTPDSVSKLMVQLLDPKEGSILDSTCGTGGFFEKVKENHPSSIFQFYGQEYNQNTLALAKLRFAFSADDSINFTEAKDTLNQDGFPNLKVDYVLMHPPFNVRNTLTNENQFDPRFEYGLPPKSNANLAWVQHAIYHLKENGKAAILLSNGSLNSRVEFQMRKNIIAADLVEAIISLPSQLFSNTSIPASIWLLNKHKAKKDKVLFIDSSNLGQMVNRSQRILSDSNILELSKLFESWQKNDFNYKDKIGFVKSVDLSEISNNDFLLAPSRYVGIKGVNDIDLDNSVMLNNIIEYVRPTRLEPNTRYKRLSIKDLAINADSFYLKPENLSEGELNPNYRELKNNVLLLSRLGSKIKPTYFKSSKDHLAYTSSGIYAFKVDLNKVTLEYLIAELHKDYIKKQIENFRKGAGIPFIRKEDLLSVKIKLPQPDKQKEIFEKERELRFQAAAKDLGFEKEIAKLKDSQMKDLGSKKHNIMQHLNNVKSSADVLTEMMELNKGILKFDDIIDPRRGVTVEKRFLRLQESLDKVIYYVDNITNELKYDKAEIINPAKFIKECKERGIQNKLFSVENIVESATFEGREPLISISKNDFEEVYNNLLENAINHGFVDKNKSYIFRVTIAYIDDYLEINFVNNGKPFPKGIAQKIGVKGEKAGATAGTGIGLWKVTEIAKHFDCKLEVFDEPSSEFPVGFKFKFNIETL
jgi:type I restriction enzyme M protein